jgi:iron(III) transport system ATP-binding protein
MSDGAPRISVRHLTKVYRTRRAETIALDDVSLEVAVGEILVLLGPSGCGKTTLLRCVAGLEVPDTGEISVHNRPVFSSERRVYLPPEQRRLSMVFQSYALWPHMTVHDNVAYPLQNSGVHRREIGERVDAVLGVVGLGSLAAAFPGQLSGGQQQRVALARAIVSNEGVILFDEPLSNLDAKVRERIRIELLALHHDIRFSALYVTHDQTEATALADRLAVMQVGHIAQTGTPTEIYYAPTSRYVAGFIGSANEVEGTVSERSSDLYLVDTPVGRLVGHPVAAASLPPGTRVTVLFRPEHCRIVADSIDDGTNRLVGQVQRSMFLGSYMEYQVSVADVPLVLREMGGGVLPEGHEVCISLAPEHTHVFPLDD